MGWLIFGVINRYVILPVFDALAGLFSSFGIVILLLVLFIKIILFPIAYKSYQSMAKMKALKPDLDKLKAKHGDNQQEFAAAQMGLYKQAGVNPVAGCLPQLLQIPFLFALFRFFPNAIQLRQKDFLWANDLSTYDALFEWNTWIFGLGTHLSIFTILMTAATLLNTWYNSQYSSMQTGSSDNAMAQQMKILMYVMPLIFFFVLNDFPSGLTYYYLLSTLFTMGQQFFANKLIDTDKLRAGIETNIKNSNNPNAPVKKSRFQQRLEAAMEAQKQLQETKKKK
jgi:YidC/Oxa1 family membrane protein insertase